MLWLRMAEDPISMKDNGYKSEPKLLRNGLVIGKMTKKMLLK